LFRNQRHHMQEVQVIVFPELNELLPWLLIIALHTYPVFLLIAEERQLIVKLGPNETLMIIGGRINQMADNFFGRPFYPPPGKSDSDVLRLITAASQPSQLFL
jgi:hypothetical protein